MKMLQKQSLKNSLFVIIFLYILSIAMVVVMIPSLSNLAKEPIPLEEVDFTGDIEGLYVTGTLYVVYDCYCEETVDDRLVAREYVIDADDYYYLGLRAEDEHMDDAESLLDAYIKYLEGSDDGTLMMDAQYQVTGVIKEMPSDSKQFYYELADWYEIDTSLFLPYYIEAGSIGAYDTTDLIIFGVGFLLCFGIATFTLVSALTGKYQKAVKKYIDSCPNAELANAKIEAFLQNTPLVNGLRYNHEFICGNNGATTVFGETPKLAWAYKHVVNHKRYFITVSKSYAIVLGFTDGTRQMVNIRKEAMVDEHLQKLQQLCPKAVFGYSKELDQMFSKNLSQFLNLRYYAPEQSEQPTTE